MGTNYYAYVNTSKVLRFVSKCLRADYKAEEVLHIGKASKGWAFTFRGYNKDELTPRVQKLIRQSDIKSYKDWLNVLSLRVCRIFDEYDEEISLKDFKKLVEHKRGGRMHDSSKYVSISKDCHAFFNVEFS